MATRVITGLILAVAVVTLVTIGPFPVLAAVVAAAVLVALHEFLGLLPGLKHTDRLAGLLGGAAVLAAAAGAPDARLDAALVGTVATSVGGLLLLVLLTPLPMENAGRRAAHLITGLIYVAGFGCAAILIARGDEATRWSFQLAKVNETGRWLLLVAGAVTWANDSAAFFAGKLFGRHRMYAAVSPKKTWEGSAGGMVGSVLGAFLVTWAVGYEVDPVVLTGFALVGGALGQAGDLVESVFKRSYDVKDSGTILPGHGGLLDRIDAFLFVAPAAYAWFFRFFTD
jgi:phosphatidate cytidylyltransferase